jgi:hypothetical protein
VPQACTRPWLPNRAYNRETTDPEAVDKIDGILRKGDTGADARRFITLEFRWTCAPKIRRQGMPVLWNATVELSHSNRAVHPAIGEAEVPEGHLRGLLLRRQSPRVPFRLFSQFYSKPLPSKMLLADVGTYQ